MKKRIIMLVIALISFTALHSIAAYSQAPDDNVTLTLLTAAMIIVICLIYAYGYLYHSVDEVLPIISMAAFALMAAFAGNHLEALREKVVVVESTF